MSFINKFLPILFSIVLIAFIGCKDDLKEYTEADTAFKNNLFAQIKKNPELSKFSEYLTSTGYDKLLESSKAFTVWAPDNAALEQADPAILNDEDRLKQFIGNHISFQEYFVKPNQPSVRIKMINAKYLSWSDNKLDGIEVISANQYTRNGVLHVISSAIAPRKNCWELLDSLNLTSKNKAYIKSLDYLKFVDSLAVKTGVDPKTGKPVYQEGTGYVLKNSLLEKVAGLDKEDSLYTLFLLMDDSFDNQAKKLEPYFKTITNNTDSTKKLSLWHLQKDLIVPGLYSRDNLPDTLISKFGIKVPVDKSAIKHSIKTSNGIIYVMEKMEFRLKDKFPPVIIEGEEYSSYSNPDKYLTLHKRYKDWASQKLDLRVYGHAVNAFRVYYRKSNINVMKYKVYWRAVNDVTSNRSTFSQKIAINQVQKLSQAVTVTEFPYTPLKYVDPSGPLNVPEYGEVLLGEFTSATYGDITMHLISAASTSNDVNPLVLDYIKLVPVF